MADPRKPIRMATEEEAGRLRHEVHQVLLASTEVGASTLGMTGCSFVVIGIQLWAAELAELEERATARYLRALADFFDPGAPQHHKQRAEKRRATAVRDIFAALDLEMSEAMGHG